MSAGVRVRRWLAALAEPIPAERGRLNEARWALLPERLRTSQQTMGRGHHSCGATYGVMERCDFACTSCYLSKTANATTPLEEAKVRAQLDALRAYLGPQGKAQITSGEVTLLPVETLGTYVAYARKIGLDPMVMTHGQRLLEKPEYLRRLVADFGLKKLSIHVDSTQRGRRGWRRGIEEQELHPIRDAYAHLIRETRRATGRTLHVATTVTVHLGNLEQIPQILDWILDNNDAFRMVSFQPVAAVGRTQDSRIEGLTLDGVWEQICSGVRQELNRHAMYFGHPECHIVAPVVVVRCGEERFVLETARAGKRWDKAFLGRLMQAFGGFSTYDKPRWLNTAQLLLLGARHPRLLLEAPFYGLYRLWGVRRRLASVAGQLLRLRPLTARPLALIVHKFMSPDELDTPVGRERLAACVFQLPVEGHGMVPMCQMNATDLRSSLDQARREKSSP
ncbi:MAG: hypothetical protein SX243_06370 [Acidobacteriota bacterium]|nr:hypothetical protein [Acidobacteriota bacterium]